MSANLDEKYPYIRAWGRMMGSFNDYIVRQQEQALKDGAPSNATYKKDGVGQDGKWNTTDDVTNLNTRQILKLPMREVDELRSESYKLWDQLSEAISIHRPVAEDPMGVDGLKKSNDLLRKLIAVAKEGL